MANTVNYVLDINFKNALKAADEFASKLDSSISEAMKHNRGFTGLIQGFNKVNEKQEKFHKLQKAYSTAESLRQKKLNNDLSKHYNELTKNLKEVEDKLTSSVGLRKAEREELEKQKALLQDELRIANDLETNFEAFEKSHKASAAILAKEVDSLGEMAERIAQSAESAKELKASLKGLIDPGKLGENLESAAERAADAFKDGIDVQALSRDLGKGLGKGINVAFKAMSGIGGGGKLGTAILAVGGAIAGTVAALGVLLAAFIAVDKKVKEFNKEVVKTHGALSLMRMGGGDLNKSLQVVKRTVMDLTGNLGVSEQEAAALFDTLDKGGLTFDRLTRGAANAAGQQRELSKSLREMHSIANLMGVGLSEYADNLTNYVNDLAMSVDTVNDSFAAIADMAAKSSFGTRRFYSMVVQATSGQASLNTRLEDTGDLLLRMSKIMGAKKAAEAVGGEASRLAEQSAQDRAKTILVTGGRGRQIYQREAQIQSGNFLRDIGGSGAMKSAFQDALRGVGAIRTDQAAPASAEELQRVLSKLTPEQQRGMLARVRASGQDEMARRLEQITQLNLGATGGLSAGVGGIGALGAGGSFAMQAAMMERFMDPTTGRLSVENRAAAESVTGLSGTRMDAMLSAMAAQRGDFELMTGLLDQIKTGTDQQKTQSRTQLDALLKRYNGALKLSRDGTKIQDSLGNDIRNTNDLFQVTSERTTADLAKLKDEATSIAYQTMDATTSVADILENKVAVYIQRLYEWANGWLGPLLTNLLEEDEQQKAFKLKSQTASAFEKEIEKLQKQGEGERTRMARLSATATTATATPEEKTQAQQELQQLQQAAERRSQQIQGYREAVQRVRGGDTYDTRNVRVQFERAATAGEVRQLTGPRGEGGAGAAGAAMARRGAQSTDTMNFATYEEAQAYIRAHPELNARIAGETQISAADAVRRAQARMGITPGSAPAPGTTPAPSTVPAAGTPAAGTTPAGGAAPTPVATTPPPARVTEAANAPTVEAVTEAHEDAQAHNQRQRREQRQRNAIEDRNMERLIKGKEMGDGIAVSALPDAIATADAKMRLLEGLTEAQLHDPALVGRLLGGTATPQDIGGLAGPQQSIARALGSRLAPTPNDFIYQNSGGRSVITPINSEDQIMGMRPGGPIANATGRGTGGNVTINVNGGDERRVFEVVRRAIQQAGITPNRVPSGAT